MENREDGPGQHRHALLRVDPRFLVDACKGLDQIRTFKVSKNALPDDAELVNVRYSHDLLLVLASSTFDEVEYGKEPVLKPPELTSIFVPALEAVP